MLTKRNGLYLHPEFSMRKNKLIIMPRPATTPILIGLSNIKNSRLLLKKTSLSIFNVEKIVIADKKRKKSLFKSKKLVKKIKKNIEIIRISDINKRESKILLEKKEVIINKRLIIINVLEKPDILKFLSVKSDLKLKNINKTEINKK